jgi:translin
MHTYKELTEGMLASFEAKDRAREEALKLSREMVRNCSGAIRCVHRKDFDKALRLVNEAYLSLQEIRKLLRDHQDVRYAGFVDDAEQEFAEARCIYSFISRHEILTHEDVDVDLVNYLAGLGDTTGELRRHILDLIRTGMPEKGEYFLEMMEEIYYLLMLFDYPDAITRGLRRKSDLARSMLERTRGDLTNAMEMDKVANAMRSFIE